ncbi:MAG: hypothetical protein HQL02_10590 [Nitrospirae bacterium]|nr:hypothetical protein [Nitrospirota bacterium]
MSDFKDGHLCYTLTPLVSGDLVSELLEQWQGDGYIAFSKVERRLSKLDMSVLAAIIASPEQHRGDKGYLMEIDLWQDKDGVYEEVSIEREDKGFFYQQWWLDTTLQEAPNCYWRMASTLARGNKDADNKNTVFPPGRPVETVEVICPQQRLHFFITRGNGG